MPQQREKAQVMKLPFPVAPLPQHTFFSKSQLPQNPHRCVITDHHVRLNTIELHLVEAKFEQGRERFRP